MSGWHFGVMAAFDTETDSPRPNDARIVTAAHVVIDGSGGLTPTERTWVLRPTRPIPDEAAAIHGYSTERAAAEGEDHAGGVDLIAAEVCLSLRAGQPLVGHNIVYDLTVLAHELDRHDLPSLEERLGGPVQPVIDTLCLDKALHRFRKGSRKLDAVAAHYRVNLDGAHEATFDAVCAARIAWRIGQLGASDTAWRASRLSNALRDGYAAVAAMTLDELHAAQIRWAAEQAEGLADYFRRTGKHADADQVDGTWPVWPLPAVEGVASC